MDKDTVIFILFSISLFLVTKWLPSWMEGTKYALKLSAFVIFVGALVSSGK